MDGVTGLKDRLAEPAGGRAPKALAKDLAALTRKVEAKPDQTATVDAQTFLTTAQLRLGDYREAMRKSKAAELAYEGREGWPTTHTARVHGGGTERAVRRGPERLQHVLSGHQRRRRVHVHRQAHAERGEPWSRREFLRARPVSAGARITARATRTAWASAFTSRS